MKCVITNISMGQVPVDDMGYMQARWGSHFF